MALETAVTAETAFVYEEPELEAAVVGRLKQGYPVLAYHREGDFYAVANASRGHMGYMLLTQLDVPQVAGAAVAPAIRRGYKDPAMARNMSYFFPGGGHLYAGDFGRSALLIGAGLGGIVGGYALRQDEIVCDETVCTQEIDNTSVYIGLGLAAVAWAYGILDAGDAAERVNARNGLSSHVHLQPKLIQVATQPRLGVALRLAW